MDDDDSNCRNTCGVPSISDFDSFERKIRGVRRVETEEGEEGGEGSLRVGFGENDKSKSSQVGESTTNLVRDFFVVCFRVVQICCQVS